MQRKHLHAVCRDAGPPHRALKYSLGARLMMLFRRIDAIYVWTPDALQCVPAGQLWISTAGAHDTESSTGPLGPKTE